MNDETAVPRPPHQSSIIVHRLIAGLWFGSAIFAILAATAAFRAASNSTEAANVVGAMLARWHYIALLAPLALIVLEWKRSRARMLLVLFAAIVLASLQVLADTRIRVIREESVVPISSLSPADPVRRHFGLLHGISSLLLLAQVITAGAAVGFADDPPAPTPPLPADVPAPADEHVP
jgi:hypothetical protein